MKSYTILVTSKVCVVSLAVTYVVEKWGILGIKLAASITDAATLIEALDQIVFNIMNEFIHNVFLLVTKGLGLFQFLQSDDEFRAEFFI